MHATGRSPGLPADRMRLAPSRVVSTPRWCGWLFPFYGTVSADGERRSTGSQLRVQLSVSVRARSTFWHMLVLARDSLFIAIRKQRTCSGAIYHIVTDAIYKQVQHTRAPYRVSTTSHNTNDLSRPTKESFDYVIARSVSDVAL